MEKEFVPYELALKLKELGFDNECLATYWKDGEFSRNPSHNMEDLPIEGQPYMWSNSKIHVDNCTAPLWQQAFDWFREKGFDNGVSLDEHKSYCFEIWNFETKSICYDYGYINYREARQACLEKLIELCKNK